MPLWSVPARSSWLPWRLASEGDREAEPREWTEGLGESCWDLVVPEASMVAGRGGDGGEERWSRDEARRRKVRGSEVQSFKARPSPEEEAVGRARGAGREWVEEGSGGRRASLASQRSVRGCCSATGR